MISGCHYISLYLAFPHFCVEQVDPQVFMPILSEITLTVKKFIDDEAS